MKPGVSENATPHPSFALWMGFIWIVQQAPGSSSSLADKQTAVLVLLITPATPTPHLPGTRCNCRFLSEKAGDGAAPQFTSSSSLGSLPFPSQPPQISFSMQRKRVEHTIYGLIACCPE